MIYSEIENFFKVQEVVSKKVYSKYGKKAWMFIDNNALLMLLELRKHFNRPIMINNWHYGGILNERGLRTNVDPILYKKTKEQKMYISGHVLGKAFDITVKGLTSEEVVKEIIKNKDKFKFITRIENPKSTPTWVHFDLIGTRINNEIYIFKI